MPAITRAFRDKMFLVYQETGSIGAVSTRCKIHRDTAKRYRKIDKWDERIRRIEEVVKRKVDEKVVNRRLRNVKVLDLAIEDIKKSLETAKSKGVIGLVEPKYLAKLVVAQDYLIGRGAADEDQTELSPEVKSALEFLQSLGPKALVQLSDYISRQLAQQAQTKQGDKINTNLLPDTSSGKYVMSADYKVKPKNHNDMSKARGLRKKKKKKRPKSA